MYIRVLKSYIFKEDILNVVLFQLILSVYMYKAINKLFCSNVYKKEWQYIKEVLGDRYVMVVVLLLYCGFN